MGGQMYLLNENDIEEIDHEIIPAKIDDTISLFNPIEIEYIESEQSISCLNIRGKRFICTLTLNELESRLEDVFQHIGVLTDNSGFYERLSVRDNLSLFAEIYGVPDSSMKIFIEAALPFPTLVRLSYLR